MGPFLNPDIGRRFRLSIVRALSAAIGLALEAVSLVLFTPFVPSSTPCQILVHRVGNVGDILIALPVLTALRLRYPDAHICILTSPGARNLPSAAPLLVSGGVVDKLIMYYSDEVAGPRGILRLAQRLRAEHYDLFIALPDQPALPSRDLRILFFARLAGCSHAVGAYNREPRLFERDQALALTVRRESDRLYDGVAQVLNLGPMPTDLRLQVPSEAHAYMSQLLEEEGVGHKERLVAMHPGAKRHTNRWFPDRFAQVGDAIQSRNNIRLIITGSQSEVELANQVANVMKLQPIVLVGKTTLTQLAALYERTELVVCNDTGAMHLAAAVGTPTVSIFSARSLPNRFSPMGDHHTSLRSDAPCSPCHKEVCDKGLICLDRISAQTVIQSVLSRLDGDVSLPSRVFVDTDK